MKTLLIAAALIAPTLAEARETGRQFDLYCAGKTDTGKRVQHWLSIDTRASTWCFRDAEHAACQIQPFTAADDGLSASSDDPEAKRSYSFTVSSATGDYDYHWDFAPHPSEDGRNPTIEVEEHGRCTPAAFTPYREVPRRAASCPMPAGKRF